MYGKILISCDMEVLTGMHIGAGDAFAAIGAMDSPVVRDIKTGLPMVPGSSLKGKMRLLLAKETADTYTAPAIINEPPQISRLFGTPGNSRRNISPRAAQLQFADAFLCNAQEIAKRSALTEVKYENTIDRHTAQAMPRPIERTVRGGVFQIRLVYDIDREEDILPDMHTIAQGFQLLSMDYLGGHGSRGYGRVGFSAFEVKLVAGSAQLDGQALSAPFKDVADYAIFNH